MQKLANFIIQTSRVDVAGYGERGVAGGSGSNKARIHVIYIVVTGSLNFVVGAQEVAPLIRLCQPWTPCPPGSKRQNTIRTFTRSRYYDNSRNVAAIILSVWQIGNAYGK
jgi:hypothetical protein